MKNLLLLGPVCLALALTAQAQVPAPNHTVVHFQVRTGGTNFGTLDLELFDQEKPETVRNFLMYVYSGAYSNLVLHTLVPNVLLEAGHVRVEEPSSTNAFFTYPLWEDFGFITNEFAVGPRYSNDFGTIAMVRFPGQTNSASFEWFINLTNNASFNTNDGGTTVFGRVVNTVDARSGTNLLNYFNTFSSTQLALAFIFDYGEFLNFLPVSFKRAGLHQMRDLFTVQPSFLQGGEPRDPVAPTLQVTEPPAGVVESTDVTMMFAGTAADNGEVVRVLYDSATGRSQVANGRENWNANVWLALGTNRVSVRSVDRFGNKSPSVERTIFNPFAQLGLTIVGKGKVLGARNGQLLQLGAVNRLEARPAPGNYFLGWSGDVFASVPIIEFRTEDLVGDGFYTNITATFTKTFLGLSNGTYQGIFYSTNSGSARGAGWISINVGPSGRYAGTINPIGARYTIRGQFDRDGYSDATVPAGSQVRLQLALTTDRTTEAIGGLYEDGAILSPVFLYRVQKFTRARPTALAGTHSFLISPAADPNVGGGHGYGAGSVTIDASGKIKLSGALGDGIAIKQTAKLLKNDQWPFFAMTADGREAALGWLHFSDANVVTGEVKWWAPQFPGNINQNAVFSGARFSTAQRLVNWTNGVLTLSGGGLAEPITSDVTLNEDGSITVLSNTNNVQFGLADARGQVAGRFTHPVTGDLTPLQGAALQSSNIIGGFFGTAPSTGRFWLQRKP